MSDFVRICCLCVVIAATGAPCLPSLHAQEVSLDRSGLVYLLGRVERMSLNSAVIDLGDVHTLKPGERLAVFRGVENYYVPVGAVKVSETESTFSHAASTAAVKPAAGDIVMAVREFSDLLTPELHSDRFFREQLVKHIGANGYSTVRRSQESVALQEYLSSYPKWRSSDKRVVGFLTGNAFSGGKEERLRPLLNQIDLFRDSRREGSNSLAAAGEDWVSVMNVLFGPTVVARHAAAQKVISDENVIEDKAKLPIREIRRQVKDEIFDRVNEEQNLMSYMVARAIEEPPRSLDFWLPQRFAQSQFPRLADDSALVDQIRNVILALQGDR